MNTIRFTPSITFCGAGSTSGARILLNDRFTPGLLIEMLREIFPLAVDCPIMGHSDIPRGMIDADDDKVKPCLFDWLRLNAGDQETVAVYFNEWDANDTITEALCSLVDKFESRELAALAWLQKHFPDVPDAVLPYLNIDAIAVQMASAGIELIEAYGKVFAFAFPCDDNV